jgi:hypothetical protein
LKVFDNAIRIENIQHRKKRVFEEYEGSGDVQRIGDWARLLETSQGKALVAAKTMEPERPRPPAPSPPAPAEPMSPQKARIMRAIANTGKPRRV